VQVLPGWQRKALLAAAQLNVDVQVDEKGRPFIRLEADGKSRPRIISLGIRKRPLHWAMAGCLPGVQHFKFCEPRAAATEAALECKQCACLMPKVGGTGARNMPASEEQLMRKLYRLGICDSMCAQVAVGWWRGRVDFLHAQRSVLIQADGTCHDTGMYDNSTEKLLQRDVAFCAAAYAKFLPAGGSVLRVRTCESDWQDSLETGFQLAAGGGVIVLSPSYSAVMVSACRGVQRAFPEALRDALPRCVYTERNSWHVFQWRASN
jgi:very-short-patch-repair endonuclease